MATLTYVFTVRDGTNTGGLRKTGLTPTFVFFQTLPGAVTLSQPAITEIGNGQYYFQYDPEANGEATCQVDAGAALTNAADRYIDLIMTRPDSRVMSALSSTGKVTLDLTQAVPFSNTTDTVGDCLNAARVQGFGKWVLSGTTLTLYQSDGATAAHTFTIAPNSSAPTSRT